MASLVLNNIYLRLLIEIEEGEEETDSVILQVTVRTD